MSGGASGEVIQPAYMIAQHAKWLNDYLPTGDMLGLTGTALTDYNATHKGNVEGLTDFNVHAEMVTAAAVNPYTGVAAYDPAGDLDDMEDRLDTFTDSADDVDSETTLQSMVSTVLSLVDNDIQDEARIDAVVDSYETRTEARFARETGRAMASLLGGRAVMTTHFDHVLAGMEQDRRIDVSDFDAKMRLAYQDQRAQYVTDLGQKFIGLIQLQLTSQQAATGLMMDLGRLRIAATQDQINIDQQFDEGEARWRLGMFEYGNQTIAAYSGGGPIPRPATKGERLMQAVLSSAQIAISGGMAIGSPQAGIALGAASLITNLMLGGFRNG